MAKYALIIIGPEVDPAGHQEQKRLGDCLATAESNAATSKQIERIARGVWLIPLESDLQGLAGLVKCAADWKIPARTLMFDEKPSFLQS